MATASSTMESSGRPLVEKTGASLLDESTQFTCLSCSDHSSSHHHDDLVRDEACAEEKLFEFSNIRAYSIFLPDGDADDYSRLEDEVDAFATFNSKVLDEWASSHGFDNIAACALIKNEEETRLQDLKRPAAVLLKFVGARVDTFSNNMGAIVDVESRLATLAHNIDYAQAHAECITRSIAKGAAMRTMEDVDPSLLREEEESHVADFVLSRVSAFARNIDYAQERTEALARGLGNLLQRSRASESP